jgi:hypothetical protein
MVFRHRAAGSSGIITTQSPIYEYGVTTGNPLPPMTDKWPADAWTHKLPKPKGERNRYNDSTPARDSESGAQFVFGPGKSDSGATAPSGKYSNLNLGVPRGIPTQDRFNQGFGRIGSGEMEARGRGAPAAKDRGVRYVDSKGRVTYRGRSG